MRVTALSLIGVLGLAVAAASARAAPVIPDLATQHVSGIVQVWGGCGWGFRPVPGHWSPWRGWVPPHCAPIRRPWGYYRGGYYGGGYPYWYGRRWYGY